MWECEWRSLYKADAFVNNHPREIFPYRCLLSGERLMQKYICGRTFGYVQYNTDDPEHLKKYFSNFLAIFKNTVAPGRDSGNTVKECAVTEIPLQSPGDCSNQTST